MRHRVLFHVLWVGGLMVFCSDCGSDAGSSPHPGVDAAAQDGGEAGEVDGTDSGGFAFVVGDGAGAVSEPICPASIACPAAAPVEGTPCDPPTGFDCEYGDDPNSLCNIGRGLLDRRLGDSNVGP